MKNTYLTREFCKNVLFLADENIPPKVVEFLINKGHKVKDVREENLNGISDDALINLRKRRFCLNNF